jgi:hypothetical protein
MRAAPTSLVVALAVAGLAGGSCDAPPPPAAYPPGTVLAVAGEPISGADVERAADHVALIYPSRSREFLIASALGSIILPRAAVAHAYADARDRARAACEAALARARNGEDVAAPEHTGGLDALRLPVFGLARELEVGAWGGPCEVLGSFTIVQLVAREEGARHASEERITVRLLEFGYLPAGFGQPDVAAAMDAARLEIVDPDYALFVPDSARYRMKGRNDP